MHVIIYGIVVMDAMYIKRHMERTLLRQSKAFGAVLLTGSRQVGKTTMLRKTMADIGYITLDDPLQRAAAKQHAGTFFKDNPPPVVVDEAQYAPELFPYIKMSVDESGDKGQFFLSGSQQFHMMKNVSESLAGRVAILNLLGLSLRERTDTACDQPFLPTEDYFTERKNQSAPVEYQDIWEMIYCGSMPEVVANLDRVSSEYYAYYTSTYIERDVRELTQVGDEMKFLQFITAAAAMNGQLLNMASLSRDIGVSQPTVERWLSILCASGIVYLLQPYHNNLLKRVVKTPKLYFLDTGLAAYLCRWPNAKTLSVGAQAGAFFESFVISETLKSYYNSGVQHPPLYFYRDHDGVEIDLLIQQGDVLYPIEIKKHADPKPSEMNGFSKLDKIAGVQRGSGGIVCMYNRLLTLSEQDKAIPVWLL